MNDLDSGVKQFMAYIEQDTEYLLGLQLEMEKDPLLFGGIPLNPENR